MARRYMDDSEAARLLTQGRPVEQWLGHRIDEGDRIIQWLRIVPESNGRYELSLYEVFDQGDLEYTDISSFRGFDPDTPYGVPFTYDDAEAAIEGGVERGAVRDRFFGSGMIDEEYRDFIEAEGIWQADR